MAAGDIPIFEDPPEEENPPIDAYDEEDFDEDSDDEEEFIEPIDE